MMTTWSWMADAVLATLLAATLVMAVRLDRALRVVRRDRSSFEMLISNLGAATASVKAGIQALRAEAERAAEQVEHRSVEAGKMATDLSFLVEAADRAGARLEQTLHALSQAGSGPRDAPAAGRAPPAQKRNPGKALTKAAGRAAATVAPAMVAAPAAHDDERGPAHDTAASDAELRARAGIVTRRRAQRTEGGAAMIKLVG